MSRPKRKGCRHGAAGVRLPARKCPKCAVEKATKNELHFDDFGPIQAQIVSVGGIPDSEGMVEVTLRCTPEDVRKFGEGLYRWGECTFSSVRIEEIKDG